MPEDVAPSNELGADGTGRDHVQLFLGQLEGLMHRVILIDGRRLVAVSEEDWTSLVDAFREGREQFGVAQDSLNSGDFDERLAEAGMTGDQGKFKFGGWFRRLRDFYRSPRAAMLGRALDWADGILDSLGAIPGVEPIKEIKGFLEKLLSEAPREPRAATAPPTQQGEAGEAADRDPKKPRGKRSNP